MLPINLKSIGDGIILLRFTPAFNCSCDNKSLPLCFVEPVKVLYCVQINALSYLQKDIYASLLFYYRLNLNVPSDCT